MKQKTLDLVYDHFGNSKKGGIFFHGVVERNSNSMDVKNKMIYFPALSDYWPSGILWNSIKIAQRFRMWTKEIAGNHLVTKFDPNKFRIVIIDLSMN